MADSFISYSRLDRHRVAPIADALISIGMSVWWDPNITPGSTFDEVIDQELTAAKCVIVVWSNNSIESRWVREEANDGLERDILVPVLIDDVQIPLGFRLIQTEPLIDWDGGHTLKAWKRVVQKSCSLVEVKIVYAYFDHFREAKIASELLKAVLIEGPNQSAAGTFIRFYALPEVAAIALREFNVSIALKPKHEVPLLTHIYVEQISALPSVTKIIGSMDEHRLSATKHGLHYESTLTPSQVGELRKIPFVRVANDIEHNVDHNDARMLAELGWTSKDESFHQEINGIKDEEDFAETIIKIFEDITLCELSLTGVDLHKKQDEAGIVITISTTKPAGTTLTQGSMDPRLMVACKQYAKTLAAQYNKASPPAPQQIQPIPTNEGLLISVLFLWTEHGC